MMKQYKLFTLSIVISLLTACEPPEEDPSDFLEGSTNVITFTATWAEDIDLDIIVSYENFTYSYAFQNEPNISLDRDCQGQCSGGNSESITFELEDITGEYLFWVNTKNNNTIENPVEVNFKVTKNSEEISSIASVVIEREFGFYQTEQFTHIE